MLFFLAETENVDPESSIAENWRLDPSEVIPGSILREAGFGTHEKSCTLLLSYGISQRHR